VRKAAARLLGLGLAAEQVAGGLLEREGRAGELALRLYMQLEGELVDEPLCLQVRPACLLLPACCWLAGDGGSAGGAGACRCYCRFGVSAYRGLAPASHPLTTHPPTHLPPPQAVKCLVYLGRKLHQQAPPPEAPQQAAANGTAANGAAAAAAASDDEQQQQEEVGDADDDQEQQEGEGQRREGAGGSSSGDDEEESESDDPEQQRGGQEQQEGGGPAKLAAITFKGLVTRMAKLADDQRYARQAPRAAALKFIAALSSSLGAAATVPYLRHMLRPLYRLTEPGQAKGAPEEARQLGEQVLAHLRDLVGADVLLGAYNAAREGVKKVGQRWGCWDRSGRAAAAQTRAAGRRCADPPPPPPHTHTRRCAASASARRRCSAWWTRRAPPSGGWPTARARRRAGSAR
jgi:hypothetical protein